MRSLLSPLSAFPKIRAAVASAVLLAAALGVVELFAQSTPFPSAVEREIWKEIGPWDNLLNNKPGSVFDFFDEFDFYDNPIYYSQSDNFQEEFDKLVEVGECTYSHLGDHITWGPLARRCKGPNGEAVAPPVGALLNPVGLAVDGVRVYVADNHNNRIQVFDFEGNPTQLEFPIGNGEIGDIHDPEGNQYEEADGTTGERLAAPHGVAVDAAHQIVVADTFNGRVAVFAPNGQLQFDVPIPQHLDLASRPTVVALSPGATVLPPDPDAPALTGPAADHRIVVTNWYHCTVQIFDTRWNLIDALPDGIADVSQHEPADGCLEPSAREALPREFSTTTGVTVDAANRIYVSDHAQSVVKVFDKNGVHLGEIGRPDTVETDEAALDGPLGLVIDHLGRLGVVDGKNSRVAFYTLEGGTGAPVATFEFQLDITISFDDFTMAVAEQVGTGPGLDPKGRFLATDPLRRQVVRFEMPDLAIVNAVAEGGIGSFDVAVPRQKTTPVQGVEVTVVPVQPGVSVVAGSLTPSSGVNIAPGHLVHYTFEYTMGGSPTATFDINARGDFHAGSGTWLANAPEAQAQVQMPCQSCSVSHQVYYADAPELTPAELVVTPPVGDPDWYGLEVFVRITPDVPDGGEEEEEIDPDAEVVEIRWFFEGEATGAYGAATRRTSVGEEGYIDVLNRVGGVSALTYWPVTRAGTVGPRVTIPLNLDLDSPGLDFVVDTPHSGTDPETNTVWHNQPVVTVQYHVGDEHSGTADDMFEAPTPDGALDFIAEGRGQTQSVTVTDYVGRTSTEFTPPINIDRGAPQFVELGPIEFTAAMTGQDGAGRFATLSAGAYTLQATDPPLATTEPGSRPGPFAVSSPAGKFYDGDLMTFTATDYAGNSSTRTAVIRVAKSDVTVTYVSDHTVVYGTTLTMTAMVEPASATGNVRFTMDGHIATAALQDQTLPNGQTRRVAIVTRQVLSDVTGSPYLVTVEYLGDEAFDPAATSADVTVTPYPVVVTIDHQSKYYHDPDPELTFTSVPASLFVPTDHFAGTPVIIAGFGVGHHPERIVQGSLRLRNQHGEINSNYHLTVTSGDLTVVGVVQVVPNPKTIVYGQPDPAFDFQYGLFPPGTAIENVTVPPTCSAPAGPRTVNIYNIIQCEGGVSDLGQLLEFVYPKANLTVERATPTVTVSGGPFVYDGQPHPATCTVTGIPGETAELSATGTYAGGSVPVNAGTVAATCTFTGSTNYHAATGQADIVINRRPITVRADSFSLTLGAPIPALTYQIVSGSLVPGDTLSGALIAGDGGLLGLGGHTIGQGSLTAGANYDLTFLPGTLTIAVLPVNNAPVAVDDEAETSGAAPVDIDVLANDSDPDEDTLTITGVTQPDPSAGTVTLTGGLVKFTPVPGFVGDATFTYTVSDGRGGTDTATVTVTVTEPACSVPGAPAVALVRSGDFWVNGTLQGSVQLMTAFNVTLNSTANITGNLLLPGTPGQTINGTPGAFGGVVDGTGSPMPTSHHFTINSGARLGQLVRRTDAIALPAVVTPANPTGTRVVWMNNASDNLGDFATLRDLTLNSNVGPVVVPAGVYGNFTANTNTAFVLGVAGATTPAVYHFQTLTLNSGSALQIVGPVEIVLLNGTSFNGPVGTSEHPEWLTLRVANGDLTLNSNVPLYGYVEVPSRRVTINNGARLVGGLAANQLTINSGGLLQLVEGQPQPCVNRPPVAQDDLFEGTEDDEDPVTGSVAGNDSDDDGDPLTFSVVDQPSSGTLVFNDNGTFTYTAAPNVCGNITFTYRASDGTAHSNVATVTIALECVKESVTVEIEDLTVTYNGDEQGIACTVSNGLEGTLTYLGVTPTIYDSSTPPTNAGLYDVTCTFAGNGDYEEASGSATLTIEPKPVTVTAGSGGKIYGTMPDPALGNISTTGFIQGDIDSGGITLTQSRVDAHIHDVGDYETEVEVGGPLAANYVVTTSTTGTFKIMPATVTVTPAPKVITYGQDLPEDFEFAYGAFPAGTDAGDIDTAPTCAVTGTPSAAGSYAIVCSGGQDHNLVFDYKPANLTINKAVLTVTADSKSKAAGIAIPQLTYTITGFVGGDTAATAVKGVPALSTTATTSSPVGSYSITVAAGSLAAANYTFTFVPGTLTVTAAGKPSLSLTKTVDKTSASAGDTLTYTLTYVNTGAATATSIVLTDPVPSNTTFQSASGNGKLSSGKVTWNVSSLAAGASASVTLTVKVNNVSACQPASSGHSHHRRGDNDDDDDDHKKGRNGHKRGDGCDHDDDDNCVKAVTNSASISAKDVSSKSSNTVSTSLVPPAKPVLTLTKSVNKTTAAPGDTLIYTLTYANTGKGAASNVVISDAAPSNTSFVSATGGGSQSSGKVTWTVASLAPGASASVTMTVRIGSSVAVCRPANAKHRKGDNDDDDEDHRRGRKGHYRGDRCDHDDDDDCVKSVTNEASIKSTQTSTKASNTVTTTLAKANRVPTVSASDRTDTKGKSVTVQITGSDPDGDALTYSASGLPKGLSMSSSGKITGTPSTAGTYTVTITVKDTANATGSTTFTWKVTEPNRPPTVSAANRTDDKGATVNVQIAGSDPDGDTLTYSASGLPPGLSMNSSGRVTGKPTSTGTYTVKVTVKDSSNATASATFSWKVVNANRPPDAVNDSTTTTKGTVKTITVLANDVDPDKHTLTVQSVTQPAKGSVKLNTNGTISYTPPSGFTGSTTFTYTVSDGNGGTDTATVTVTVRAHYDDDDCDHDKGKHGHRDGDKCDHDKDVKHHHDGDGCDHDKGKKGHKDGDKCDHDRHAGGHHDGDDCDHDRGRKGHRDGDGCEHDRSHRRKHR